MALSLNRASRGLLIDPTNGLADLGRRETAHHASLRFLRRSRSRLLRLIASAESGCHSRWRSAPECSTTTRAQPDLEKLIPPRALLEELKHIADEPSPAEVLQALDRDGLLTLFSPALSGAKLNLPALTRLEKAEPGWWNPRAYAVTPSAGRLSVRPDRETEPQGKERVVQSGRDAEGGDRPDAQPGAARSQARAGAEVGTGEEAFACLPDPGGCTRRGDRSSCSSNSTQRVVQERIRNYLQKYLPIMQEVARRRNGRLWKECRARPGTSEAGRRWWRRGSTCGPANRRSPNRSPRPGGGNGTRARALAPLRAGRIAPYCKISEAHAARCDYRRRPGNASGLSAAENVSRSCLRANPPSVLRAPSPWRVTRPRPWPPWSHSIWNPCSASPRIHKFMGRAVQFAMRAAREAIDQSGIDPRKMDASRVGIQVGSGQTGVEYDHFFPSLHHGLGCRPRHGLQVSGRSAFAPDRPLHLPADAGQRRPGAVVHGIRNTRFERQLHPEGYGFGASVCTPPIWICSKSAATWRSPADTTLWPLPEIFWPMSKPDCCRTPIRRRLTGLSTVPRAGWCSVKAPAFWCWRVGSTPPNAVPRFWASFAGPVPPWEPANSGGRHGGGDHLSGGAPGIRRCAPGFCGRRRPGHRGRGSLRKCRHRGMLGNSIPVTALKSRTGYMGAGTAAAEFGLGLLCARQGFLPAIARRGDVLRLAEPDPLGLFLSCSWGGSVAALAARAIRS